MATIAAVPARTKPDAFAAAERTRFVSRRIPACFRPAYATGSVTRIGCAREHPITLFTTTLQTDGGQLIPRIRPPSSPISWRWVKNSLRSRESAGNSASFGQNEHRKGLGFEGLAAKFPARASREFFGPEQGICREFFARAGNSRDEVEKSGRAAHFIPV